MSDTFKYYQTAPTSLAGAGVSLGDSSIILTSFVDIDGNLIQMTDFGNIAFGTLEPGGVNEEQISFSGITQNANNTATLTGVKTVLFKYPYTQTSGLAKTHAGGTSFIISNTAGFYDKFVAKDDDETITGVHTFTAFPVSPSSAPTTDYQFANKKYIDDTVLAGAPDASLTVKGISEEATAAEINAGTQTGGTAAQLFINPKYLQDSQYYLYRPTVDEKAALVGTSGAPSSTNKYVTDADATATATANKIVRAGAGAKIVEGYLQTTDANISTLVTGVTSNAESLHTHLGMYYSVNNINSANKTYQTYQVPLISSAAGTICGFTVTNVNPSVNYANCVYLTSSNNAWEIYEPIYSVSVANALIDFVTTKKLIVEFYAEAVGVVGDHQFGIGTNGSFLAVYNNANDRGVTFSMHNGTLYAHTSTGAGGAAHTETDISAGVTVTVPHLYRIEWNRGTNALFYVDGTLKATHTTNLPADQNCFLGFGGTSNSDDAVIFSPIISIEK